MVPLAALMRRPPHPPPCSGILPLRPAGAKPDQPQESLDISRFMR